MPAEENELKETWECIACELSDFFREDDPRLIKFKRGMDWYIKAHFWKLKAKHDAQNRKILAYQFEIKVLNDQITELHEFIRELKQQLLSMKNDCKWFYDQGWEMNEDGHYSFNDAWEIYTDSSKKVSK